MSGANYVWRKEYPSRHAPIGVEGRQGRYYSVLFFR